MKATCVCIDVSYVFYCRLQHHGLRRMEFNGTHFYQMVFKYRIAGYFRWGNILQICSILKIEDKIFINLSTGA